MRRPSLNIECTVGVRPASAVIVSRALCVCVRVLFRLVCVPSFLGFYVRLLHFVEFPRTHARLGGHESAAAPRGWCVGASLGAETFFYLRIQRTTKCSSLLGYRELRIYMRDKSVELPNGTNGHEDCPSNLVPCKPSSNSPRQLHLRWAGVQPSVPCQMAGVSI